MTRELEEDREAIEAALAIEEGLTDWEVSFVENLGRQVLDQLTPLSRRQREKLDEILRGRGR